MPGARVAWALALDVRGRTMNPQSVVYTLRMRVSLASHLFDCSCEGHCVPL